MQMSPRFLVSSAASHALCSVTCALNTMLPHGHQRTHTHIGYSRLGAHIVYSRLVCISCTKHGRARAQVGSYNSGILQFITVLRHKLRGKSRTTYVDSCERQIDWVTAVQKALSPNWVDSR